MNICYLLVLMFLGMRTLLTMLLQVQYQSIGQGRRRHSSSRKHDITPGMSQICLKFERIKSFANVCEMLIYRKSFRWFMSLRVGDISVAKRRVIKCCHAGYIGLLFSKMPLNFLKIVLDVNKWVAFQNGMRCPCSQSLSLISSMCGESTSWAHSRIRLGTYTF